MSLPYRALRYDLVQAAIHDGVWSNVDWVRFVKMENIEEQKVGLEMCLEQAMLKSSQVESRQVARCRLVTSEGRRLGKKLIMPSLRLSLARLSWKGLVNQSLILDWIPINVPHIHNYLLTDFVLSREQ